MRRYGPLTLVLLGALSLAGCGEREKNWSCAEQTAILDSLKANGVWAKPEEISSASISYVEYPCAGDEATITVGRSFRTDSQLALQEVKELGETLVAGEEWEVVSAFSRADTGPHQAAHVCYLGKNQKEATYLRLHSVPDPVPEPNFYVELTVVRPGAVICE